MAEERYVEDEVRRKRLLMLKAYADKKVLQGTRQRELRTEQEVSRRFGPLSPIKRPKEAKFNHAKGCTIAAKGQVPPAIDDKWWRQPPSKAGELCNKIQRKLSHESFWTGTQKYKKASKGMEEIGEITAGDEEEMHRAARLVSHDSGARLLAHRGGAEVHDELHFRVSLRE